MFASAIWFKSTRRCTFTPLLCYWNIQWRLAIAVDTSVSYEGYWITWLTLRMKLDLFNKALGQQVKDNNCIGFFPSNQCVMCHQIIVNAVCTNTIKTLCILWYIRMRLGFLFPTSVILPWYFCAVSFQRIPSNMTSWNFSSFASFFISVNYYYVVGMIVQFMLVSMCTPLLNWLDSRCWVCHN
jgi:hypothetical protein